VYAGARSPGGGGGEGDIITCCRCQGTAHRGCVQLVASDVAVPVEGGGGSGSSAPATETVRLEVIEPEDAWLCGKCTGVYLARAGGAPMQLPPAVDVVRERTALHMSRVKRNKKGGGSGSDCDDGDGDGSSGDPPAAGSSGHYGVMQCPNGTWKASDMRKRVYP
jgi:hypothetical protein